MHMMKKIRAELACLQNARDLRRRVDGAVCRDARENRYHLWSCTAGGVDGSSGVRSPLRVSIMKRCGCGCADVDVSAFPARPDTLVPLCRLKKILCPVWAGGCWAVELALHLRTDGVGRISFRPLVGAPEPIIANSE